MHTFLRAALGLVVTGAVGSPAGAPAAGAAWAPTLPPAASDVRGPENHIAAAAMSATRMPLELDQTTQHIVTVVGSGGGVVAATNIAEGITVAQPVHMHHMRKERSTDVSAMEGGLTAAAKEGGETGNLKKVATKLSGTAMMKADSSMLLRREVRAADLGDVGDADTGSRGSPTNVAPSATNVPTNSSLLVLHETEKLSNPGISDSNCRWTEWTDWTECSRTCGGGRRHRMREQKTDSTQEGVCANPQLVEPAETCNTQACRPKTTTTTSTTSTSSTETETASEKKSSVFSWVYEPVYEGV